MAIACRPLKTVGQIYQTTHQQEMTMRRALSLSLLLCAGIAMNVFAIGEARISGKVLEAGTKKPLTDATITVVSAPGSGKNFKESYKVNKDGGYAIFLLDGTIRYVFTFAAP